MDSSINNKTEVATSTYKIERSSSTSSSSSSDVSGNQKLKKPPHLEAIFKTKDAMTSTEKFSSDMTLYTISTTSDESYSATTDVPTPKKPLEKDSAENIRQIKKTAVDKVSQLPHGLEIETIKSEESLEEVKEKTIRFSLNDAGEPEESLKKGDGENKEFPAQSKSQYERPFRDDNSDEGSINSTNLQSGEVFVYMIIPPDGGYGWFIVLMSFLNQVVVDGIIFSIGVLLPHIAKDFNEPGYTVVLVASMQIGFYFLSGAVSSAFINKYGFRPVAMTGALLSITVLTIASCSVNLAMMIVFYSVLGGPALSMVWVSSQLIIGYYFDKYRPIANGASCSGAGIGIMSFCYMNSILVPKIGWHNVMRVHVCFLILVLLMTLTYIEVAPTRIGKVKEVALEESDSDSIDLFTGLTEYSLYSIKINNQEYALNANLESLLEKSEIFKKHSACDQCLEKWFPPLFRCLERHRERRAEEETIKRYVIQRELIEKDDLFYSGPKDFEAEQEKVEEILKKRSTAAFPTISEVSLQWRTISLDDIDNDYTRQTVMKTLSAMRVVRDKEEQKYRQTYAELKLTSKRPFLAFLSPQNWLHPKIHRAFRLLFDFRLLAIMEFRILLLSAFLFPMGFNIPFVYSTARSQIDKSYARLITPTIGLSNFIFRIISGFIAFKYREYTTFLCGGGLFIGGCAVFVSAFYGLDVVWFQFVYAFCYGMAPAFFSTLRAIIYVRTLGLDKLTNSFGLSSLAMGMGVFIGTTAGGILNEHTGSFTAAFAFAGICICSSGILKLLLPFFIKLAKAKKEK